MVPAHGNGLHRRGLGRMLELTVAFAPQDRDSTAQGLQKPPAQEAACAVVGVQQHGELPRPDAFHVDRGQDRGEMGAMRVVAFEPSTTLPLPPATT